VVVDTATEVIAPLHTPIMALLMWSDRSALLVSKKRAPAVGAINAIIVAGLEIMCFVLEDPNQSPKITNMAQRERIFTVLVHQEVFFFFLIRVHHQKSVALKYNQLTHLCMLANLH